MSTTPAGWYANPNNAAQLRYWDGSEWTDHTSQATAPAAVVLDPYSRMFNVAQLSEEQRLPYSQHQLQEFPTWAVIVLSIVTLGIFGVVYHGMKHSKLPKVRPDDFGAGKAIGFLFIPFFNLYWTFVFWNRLADRINFQYKLRAAPPPVSRDLAIWTNITGIAGSFIFFTWLAWPILACISAAQIQNAANDLANGRVQGYGTAQAIGAPATPVAVTQPPRSPTPPPPPPPPPS
jgi:hypothetical protein